MVSLARARLATGGADGAASASRSTDLSSDLALLEVSSRYSAVRRVSYPVDPMRRFHRESPQPLVPGATDSPLGRVAALLEWAYGYRPGPHPKRRSPSAGALYPTECFVLIRVEDAWVIYYYDFRDHLYYRLARLRPAALANWLEADHDTTVVVLGSVLWRSAQRYGARCYLYCLLDAGNVAANLATMARHYGLEIGLTSRSLTADHERQIGLRQGEEAILSLAVRAGGPRSVAMPPAPISLPPAEAHSLQPPMLSPILTRIGRLHRHSTSPRRLPLVLPGVRNRADDAEVSERRHSSSAFARLPLGEDVVEAMADCCADMLRDLDAAGAPHMSASLITIRAPLTPPCSRSVACDGSLGIPAREFASSDEAARLLTVACQDQVIVGGSAFALVLGVDLDDLSRYGYEAYRSAALTAGATCAELYREAARRGVGTTSIGGFFAERVRGVIATTSSWPLVVQLFGVESSAARKVDAATVVSIDRKDGST